HIWTGDIYLISPDRVADFQPRDNLTVLILSRSGNVCHQGAWKFFKERDLLTEEAFYSDIGQSDGVEDTGRSFNDPGNVIAPARIECDRFCVNCAYTGEI